MLAEMDEVLQCDFQQATAIKGVFVCNAQVACKALEKAHARAERLDQELQVMTHHSTCHIVLCFCWYNCLGCLASDITSLSSLSCRAIYLCRQQLKLTSC